MKDSKRGIIRSIMLGHAVADALVCPWNSDRARSFAAIP